LRREIDAGTYAYLPKPFAAEQLVERIAQLLASPQVVAAPKSPRSAVEGT
jgi:DNA-binding response OmpR family regulator